MRIGRTTKSQLTLIQMITCTLAIGLFGITIGILTHYSNKRSEVQDLLGLAEAIAANSEAALMFEVEKDAEQNLSILRTRDSVTAAYIYDAKGAVFASYVPEGRTPATYEPPMDTKGHLFVNDHVRVYCPVTVNEQHLGAVCIEDNLAALRSAAKCNIITLVAVMLGALLLALITASRLQSLISQPILALTHTARRVSSDSDYARRAHARGSDEIRSLNDAFNDMLSVIQQRDRALSDEIAERRKAQDELSRHRDQLEELVAARTAELERANEDLRLEIKEHERAERMLRRTLADLETTNSELERFAQVAAHDLQEPLRKMLAFSDRLTTNTQQGLGEREQDYLQRITGAATRMQFLINDLLAFSRLGRRKPIFRRVDLNAIVDGVLKDLVQSITAADATVSTDPLPTIDAEQPQMQQLFRHLISNAIKFRRQEVPLHLRIYCASEDDETVTIGVADNGIGFEQKYESRIFEIFQRLHAPQQYEGTGIGLAICRRITDVHHGTINVESRPADGTTFYITLPRKQKYDREA